MAPEQAASLTAKIALVVTFLLLASEDNPCVKLAQRARTQIRPVALHRLQLAESAQLDSLTATQDRAVLEHAKNAHRVSHRCLERPISPNALSNVPPALGLRPASPRAPHAQRELPTQTRAPPASPSASLALQVIFLFSLDKARAPFVPQELGAAVLAPSTLLPASHVPPGRTMLYQDPQV